MTIEVIKYHKINGSTFMMGKFSLKIPKWGNFIIHDMSYFQKGHQRWVSFPSKQFEKDGEKKYMPYNKFEDDKTLKAFQEQVLKALDEYFKLNGN